MSPILVTAPELGYAAPEPGSLQVHRTNRMSTFRVFRLICTELTNIVGSNVERRHHQDFFAPADDDYAFPPHLTELKGRGRDGYCWPPPARIRTCRVTAYGSCLRLDVTQRSAVPDKDAELDRTGRTCG